MFASVHKRIGELGAMITKVIGGGSYLYLIVNGKMVDCCHEDNEEGKKILRQNLLDFESSLNSACL